MKTVQMTIDEMLLQREEVAIALQFALGIDPA